MVLGSLNKLVGKISHSESEISNTSHESSSLLTQKNGEESTDDVDEISNENQSIILSIISQLRPGCDLSRITLPTFILEKKSMLERIANAFFTPEILLEANNTANDIERFVLVVKWYLSCWHIAPKAVKKPLNPILGEYFACQWNDLPNNYNAVYLAEQTSHHPPESSYFYTIPERKIRVDGSVIPRSRFLGNSIAAIMEGVANLSLGEHEEVYSLTQPNFYCRGILFGKLRSELVEHMIIKCEKTNLEADIDFKTKGLIGGTYDSIEGIIKDTKTSQVLYTISGKWNDIMKIKEHGRDSHVFYNTNEAIIHRPVVRPIEEQDDHESRKLWSKTIEALQKQNHEEATDEKFKIEDEQRAAAKKREEKGQTFEPFFFKKTPAGSNIPFDLKSEIDINNDNVEGLKEKLKQIYPYDI